MKPHLNNLQRPLREPLHESPLYLETPALLLDLAIMEENLQTMARFFRHSRAKLRPHFKNHRVLALAARQIKAGAIGVTCARLWEAERLVQNGIKNILIANEIAGSTAVKQFVELSGEAPVILAVDNAKTIADLAYEAHRCRTEVNVLIDVDLGFERCGVQPGEEVFSLSKQAIASGLRLRGLMGYEGHLLPHPPSPQKEQAVRAALGCLIDLKRRMEEEGIPVEIVTCGGTGDYSIVGQFPGVTENQAGSYLLMDTWYSSFAPDFKVALSVLATVISKTPGKRIVVDAGVKALSGERGLPSVKDAPGLRLQALHAEHAVIEIQDVGVEMGVGDKIEISVHYHDGTINLHKRMYGIRNGKVEEVFRIEH